MKQLHKFLKIFIFLQLRLIKLNIQLTLCKHILTKNARKSTTKIKKVLISRNKRKEDADKRPMIKFQFGASSRIGSANFLTLQTSKFVI